MTDVEDARAYYERIALPAAMWPLSSCSTCNGATVVRHGELTPGRPGFGTYQACPRWRSDAKRCVWRDAMGFEVTR